MKRTMRIAVWTVGLVAAVGAVFLLAGDWLLEAAVERYGSQLTGTTVGVASAELAPAAGTATLRGLVVAKPGGHAQRVFACDKVAVRVDFLTLWHRPIVVEAVTIDGLEVTWEHASGGSNVEALERRVDAFLAARGGGRGPRVVIEDLYVRNGRVRVTAAALRGRTLSAPMRDQHLTGIGRERGVTPRELAAILFRRMDPTIRNALRAIDFPRLMKEPIARAR